MIIAIDGEASTGKSTQAKKIAKRLNINYRDSGAYYRAITLYLKRNQIPFILFVSTEPVGKNGYMTWGEIKEIADSNIGFIGHHSHTHEYLIDMSNSEFVKDIEISTKIFLLNLLICF